MTVDTGCMEGGRRAVRRSEDMEHGLSSKPNDQSFLPTGLSPSFTLPSVSSEVCTLVHSERAPASTSNSSFSSPWEFETSQMMDVTAVIPACPSCDGTGSLFLRVLLPFRCCCVLLNGKNSGSHIC